MGASTYPLVVVTVPPERPVEVTVVEPIADPRSVGMVPNTAMASLASGAVPNAAGVAVNGVAVLVSEAALTHVALVVMGLAHVSVLPGW